MPTKIEPPFCQDRFWPTLGCLFALLCCSTLAWADREWPYYVPHDVTPPDVTQDGWVRNDIDRFVLRKLKAKNLHPASEASKRTIIRRLYFDLIGLPPTPEDIQRFVNDEQADAYSKLVDRLLDDPRYGERWARFWLDLARYADTAGYEGDPDLPHAWRYRDYVIDSFNKDKPYDQFIKEQIAGDEFKDIMGAGDLPGTSAENTVALTFLRLAPFTEPRGDETRHEMLSEMTSTVGSVFLGLTVGCAKCHDHKHDEIPTEDFYRMKAFFATVQLPRPERGDIYQIGGPIDADFYREGEKDWAKKQQTKLRQQAKSAKQELISLKEQIATRLGGDFDQAAGFGIQVVNGEGNDYVFSDKRISPSKPNLSMVNSDGQLWSISANGKPSGLDSLSGKNGGKWFASISSPQHISLGMHTAGSGKTNGGAYVGKIAEVLIYDHPLTEVESNSLMRYFDAFYLQTAKTPANVSIPKQGLQFWLNASDAKIKDGRVASWTDRIAKIRLEQEKADLRPVASTLGGTGKAAVDFDKHFLSGTVSGASFSKSKQGAIVIVHTARHESEGYGLEVGGEGQFVSTFVNPSAKLKADPLKGLMESSDPRITTEERRRYEFLSTRGRFVPQHLKRLKPVAMSLRHSYGPPFEPGVPVSRVRIRGEYDNLGDIVEPGFLSVITGNQDPAPIRLDPFKRWPTRSRRMALANWIANADNPMTARVMVNRLWAWHFGQGIVTTPSDFGYLSSGPSHRELLDWLAVKFVDEKWSIKAMHRLMVNSATYRQESAGNALAADLDPDNRWLWKFNRRRLEAEAIRDNVLAVSGRLNTEQFGLPIFPPLPGDVAEAVKYDNSKWDTQYGPEGRKRSLYIYQQRTLTMPLMQTFDSLVCEDSRPRRRSSVTPLQALAMYNGSFVNDEATHFANRVRRQAGRDERIQINVAFETALGRRPTESETNQLVELVESCNGRDEGLVSVCRVLLNTNEFIYVD